MSLMLRLSSALTGRKIGTDRFGNVYFEGKRKLPVYNRARRWVVYEALRNGSYYPWDFQPLRAASERYMRNHMDLNVLEENQRFPRGE